MSEYLFTSESVTEGHPDKLCDQVSDGVLDAVVFERVNWKRLPSIGWDFLLGRLFKEGRTIYLQGREFVLRAESRAAVQLDGEFVGELPARFSVLPRKLRVIGGSFGRDARSGRRDACPTQA